VHSRASAEAERLFCAGDAAGAARLALAALRANPADYEAHLVCAEATAALGDKVSAREALVRLARAVADEGDLYLALAAALQARELGVQVQGVLREIAALYSVGSERLTDARPAAPPPMPQEALPAVEPLKDAALLEAARRAMTEASDGADLAREFASDTPVPRAPIFSHLDADAFVELARALKVRRFAQGAVVVEQGTAGTSFFVVANGEVNVERTPAAASGNVAGAVVHLARLGPGSIFGEMAILSEAPRSARVVAAVPVVLLEAGKSAIEMAAVSDPRVGEEVIEHCRRRMLSNLLQLSPILRRLDTQQRAQTLRHFEIQVFAKGDVLILQGDQPTGLFLLVSGEVEVSHDDDGEHLVLAHLGPGEVVGEISLVLRRPATAHVVATHPTTVMHLPGDRFLDMVRDQTELLAELYELAIARETETLSILAAEAESADGLLL
jgi:CRP-like cAMP-binding protein